MRLSLADALSATGGCNQKLTVQPTNSKGETLSLSDKKRLKFGELLRELNEDNKSSEYTYQEFSSQANYQKMYAKCNLATITYTSYSMFGNKFQPAIMCLS